MFFSLLFFIFLYQQPITKKGYRCNLRYYKLITQQKCWQNYPCVIKEVGLIDNDPPTIVHPKTAHVQSTQIDLESLPLNCHGMMEDDIL